VRLFVEEAEKLGTLEELSENPDLT
jgi:hypothetical protein